MAYDFAAANNAPQPMNIEPNTLFIFPMILSERIKRPICAAKLV